MPNSLSDDVHAMKSALTRLPTAWEGKASILELKESNFQWKQMEWWAFYFEYLLRRSLAGVLAMPGQRYGNIVFDGKGGVNWDFKAKAIKSDDHRAILNDKKAMEASVAEHSEHGVLIALCDVEYNDVDRSFQRWHAELKGGLSKYEQKRIERTSISRYRKTNAVLTDLLFIRIDEQNLATLDTMRQGRNSNGRPRAEKYMLNLESLDEMCVDRLSFVGEAES